VSGPSRLSGAAATGQSQAGVRSPGSNPAWPSLAISHSPIVAMEALNRPRKAIELYECAIAADDYLVDELQPRIDRLRANVTSP